MERPVAEMDLSSARSPRDRILTAALELFVDQGYFNTNIPDISNRAHCSVGSIYHHFLNKEAVAKQLYLDGIHLFRDALTQTFAEDAPPEQGVKELVTAFLEFAESHRLYSQYLWQSRHSEFLSERHARPTAVGFDELGRKLTSLLRGAQRSGHVRKLRADVLWSVVFGIPISFVRDWLDGYTTRSPTQASGDIANCCWTAIRSPDKT